MNNNEQPLDIEKMTVSAVHALWLAEKCESLMVLLHETYSQLGEAVTNLPALTLEQLKYKTERTSALLDLTTRIEVHQRTLVKEAEKLQGASKEHAR